MATKSGLAAEDSDNESNELITLDEIRTAEQLLAGAIRHTYLADSSALAAKVGGPVFLKCENLQRSGSFKIRGAYSRLARLSDGEKARGVVAASAGNHAQGVALASSMLGARATVFMPRIAPLPKITATRAYGATLEFAGDSVEAALKAAQAFAEESGAIFVHPFDHRDVVAGQGTVALEIFDQCPDVKTILVPTGGGGLLAGISAAAAQLRPDVTVVGVQAEGSASLPRSLSAGHPVALSRLTTIADGIAVAKPGDLTFNQIKTANLEIVTVSDEEISRALLFCLERTKMVVEPAGAVGVAAVLNAPRDFEPPVVVVLSGGNIDPLLLVRVVEHGLAVAGRYLTITVPAPDRPGSLAGLLNLIAAQDANVLDVWHLRQGSRLPLGQAEISFAIETRGNEHSQRLVKALRTAGYEVKEH